MIAPSAAIQRLVDGGHLSREETEHLFGLLMDGGMSEAHKAALLVALRMKGEQRDEIVGAALAMRRRLRPIPHRCPQLIDTCGTGGDGQGTFNVSTAAALVAAAGGAVVAKHGNRSVSSRSGSADVLAALGVEIEMTPETAAQALAELGIAFLFAPAYHPAMQQAMPVRRELGIRTAFNLLGPLTNPAAARRQLMGVYRRDLVPLVAEVLAELGSDHALVVHGADGLDEITTTGPTRIGEVRAGKVETYDLDPGDLGVARARPAELRGGEPAENAAQLRRVLAGEGGPLSDITLVNAGAALYVAGLAPDLEAGFRRAEEALFSGQAAARLGALRRFVPRQASGAEAPSA